MELLAESAAIDSGLHPALRVSMLGEAHLLGGRLDLAQQCVDQALALADLGEEHGSRAWTLRLAAEITLAQGLVRADTAAEQYRAGMAKPRCNVDAGNMLELSLSNEAPESGTTEAMRS